MLNQSLIAELKPQVLIHCADCLSVLPVAVPHPYRENTSRDNIFRILAFSLRDMPVGATDRKLFILNMKKVGHIIQELYPVMCPIFFIRRRRGYSFVLFFLYASGDIPKRLLKRREKLA